MKKWSITLLLIALVAIGISIPAGAREEPAAYTPVAKTAHTETAYITDLQSSSGQVTVLADPIEWLEGEAADKLFQKENPDAGFDSPPDGYMIVNDDETTKTLQVAKNASVEMQIYSKTGDIADLDVEWNESIPLAQFQDLLAGSQGELLKQYPYHLTVENGVITRIVQQYIP